MFTYQPSVAVATRRYIGATARSRRSASQAAHGQTRRAAPSRERGALPGSAAAKFASRGAARARRGDAPRRRPPAARRRETSRDVERSDRLRACGASRYKVRTQEIQRKRDLHMLTTFRVEQAGCRRARTPTGQARRRVRLLTRRTGGACTTKKNEEHESNHRWIGHPKSSLRSYLTGTSLWPRL